MDFRIERIDKEDLPFLGKFIHSAKLALSINLLKSRHFGFHGTSAECFKTIDNVTGEIVGYIDITAKSQEAENLSDKKPDPKSPIPEGLNPPLLAEVNNAVGEIAKETDGMERFVLTRIRRGVGSKLVQLGIDRAKAGGVPLTVCAEAPSITFFTSLGFVETRHVDMDLRKYAPDNSGFGLFRLAGMIWRPE
ncbi:hypothetical protein N7493_002504 [Penicillium malachiteum]|uniref:N-acetyltransferase domain-containing protein n=1 Tax=Penicillium malachiteum TaxID=1324776 RepID=A0AAD6HRZ1_9EURO|nr:hypothetical protein N7493_002504 [Penicillium malachiteum]